MYKDYYTKIIQFYNNDIKDQEFMDFKELKQEIYNLSYNNGANLNEFGNMISNLDRKKTQNDSFNMSMDDDDISDRSLVDLKKELEHVKT